MSSGPSSGLYDAYADLVLGAACVACHAPGRPLCPACRASLPDEAVPAWPTPTPPGLATPFVTGAYADALRAMVLAHKENRLLALARPLGELLAVAVDAAVVVPDEGVLLVPVPSRPSALRERGYDATGTMARRAVATLRASGRTALCAPVLRLRAAVADQSGLDATARARNLEGSMWVPSGLLRRFAGRRLRVVVCDDIITTGATAREAQRALEAAGLRVHAIAAVAATRRRTTGPESSDPARIGPTANP